MQIPPAWESIEVVDWSGIVFIIGAPDVGKSTLASYLFQRICTQGRRSAYLDGDPGQSVLGPPAVLSIQLNQKGDRHFPPKGPIWRWFIGSVTPRGHMLPMLVASAHLSAIAKSAGAEVIIYDTSGLIDPQQGGQALKIAKIDLLRPERIIAIQREEELMPLIVPLRRKGCSVSVLIASTAARRRDVSKRQGNRARQFAKYFAKAEQIELHWHRFAIIPAPRFAINRLVSFEDKQGFVICLGIILEIDRTKGKLKILSSRDTLEGVVTIRLGDIYLDPQTFRDRRA